MLFSLKGCPGLQGAYYLLHWATTNLPRYSLTHLIAVHHVYVALRPSAPRVQGLNICTCTSGGSHSTSPTQGAEEMLIEGINYLLLPAIIPH